MSTPFQNRLVGTIIVAAVAIIFLPDILDGEKKTYQEEFDKIPEPPNVEIKSNYRELDDTKFDKLSTQEITNDVAVDDVEVKSDQLDTEIMQTEQSDVLAETLDDSQVIKVNSLPKQEVIGSNDKASQAPKEQVQQKLPEKNIAKQAWVIQLGTFRHQANVEELMKKLKSNGYTAFSKPITTRNGRLIKVLVGPELLKSSLEKEIPKLKLLTGVEGKMARFTPTK